MYTEMDYAIFMALAGLIISAYGIVWVYNASALARLKQLELSNGFVFLGNARRILCGDYRPLKGYTFLKGSVYLNRGLAANGELVKFANTRQARVMDGLTQMVTAFSITYSVVPLMLLLHNSLGMHGLMGVLTLYGIAGTFHWIEHRILVSHMESLDTPEAEAWIKYHRVTQLDRFYGVYWLGTSVERE